MKKKMQKEIENLKHRDIIPIKKLSMMNKIVHTLPTPHLKNNVETLLYNFLWNKKTDKVDRDTKCDDYFYGGID